MGYRDPGASDYGRHTEMIPQVLSDYWRATVSPPKIARWTYPFPAAMGGPDSCTGTTRLGECSVEVDPGVLSTYLPTHLQNYRLPDSWGSAQWTDGTRWNKRILWHTGDFGGASPPYAVSLRTARDGPWFATVTWITQPLCIQNALPAGTVAPNGRTLLAAANTICIPEFITDAQRVFLTHGTALSRPLGMIQKGAAPSYHIRWLTVRARVEANNSICGLPTTDLSYFLSHAPSSSSSADPDVPAPKTGGAEGGSD